MPTRTKRSPPDVDALLDELLLDAHGDDEQLAALTEGIAAALELPLDVRVVGEPLSLVAVNFEGNARRGLVARCRRADRTEYRVSLADVELPPSAPGYAYLAAYCQWLGVAPAAPCSPRATPTKAKAHKAADEDIDLAKPAELVVLAITQRAARCRVLGSERSITLRAGSLGSVVPGQIITVEPSKHWRHNGHPYLSGALVSARIDAAALGLTPLSLDPQGDWDPAEEYWGEEGEPIPSWARPIIERGPRPMFEMEQVLPGSDPDAPDSDPIIESTELRERGDRAGARDVLTRLLEADLRCLDAHAHLGNAVFDHSPRWALSHYEVGVRIGELSLGERFDGVLAWGLIDNRPFLRCMHGYGVCLWRLERWQEAESVFERMLWMNPGDNQGVRFLLPDVRAREPWEEGR